MESSTPAILSKSYVLQPMGPAEKYAQHLRADRKQQQTAIYGTC